MIKAHPKGSVQGLQPGQFAHVQSPSTCPFRGKADKGLETFATLFSLLGADRVEPLPGHLFQSKLLSRTAVSFGHSRIFIENCPRGRQRELLTNGQTLGCKDYLAKGLDLQYQKLRQRLFNQYRRGQSPTDACRAVGKGPGLVAGGPRHARTDRQ